MNKRLLVPRQQAAGDPLPLDVEGDAAAAYSLRSLSETYAGPVVTVERSSDATQDSFTAAAVGAGAVERFCGSGDGYVVLWNDQSGNGHDLPSVGGVHPELVTAGVINKRRGKPAVVFSVADTYFRRDIPCSDYLCSLFCVLGSDLVSYSDAGSARFCNFSFGVPDSRLYFGTGTGYTFKKIGARIGNVNPIVLREHGTDTFALSGFVTRTNAQVYQDAIREINIDPSEGQATISIQTVQLGNAGSDYLQGSWQECIMYHRNTDVSAVMLNTLLGYYGLPTA